uniref:BTB domain-containing protein n=1 Tax=Panagrolaimus sp. JU765 TaxID=591449 RepID=A0AC34R243_9BILA
MAFEIVQKFSEFIVESDISDSKRFTTPKQQVGAFDDYLFWIECYTCDDPQYVSIYLNVSSLSSITVKWVSCGNSVTRTLEHTYVNYGGFGYPKYGTKAELFKHGFMKLDSTLTFTITSKMSEGFKLRALTVKYLWEDDEFKDFTFHVGRLRLKMHKCILSTASPVFASMFRTHNPEVLGDMMFTRDYGYKVIEAAVDLMYKRELNADLTVKTLLNLYRFSKKYELVDE